MKKLLSYACMAAVFAGSGSAFSKTINMYSLPKMDSQITGTVNTETGVTIVYTPKNSEWIKIANPTNGDVGWVKSATLGGNGYHMRISTSGSNTQSYSVYQFGTENNRLNQQQLENEMRQFEQQQRMLQVHMAHMFNDMFYFPQPSFIPVVMVSEQTTHPKTVPNKQVQTPPTGSQDTSPKKS